jgi:hypothetical protein
MASSLSLRTSTQTVLDEITHCSHQLNHLTQTISTTPVCQWDTFYPELFLIASRIHRLGELCFGSILSSFPDLQTQFWQTQAFLQNRCITCLPGRIKIFSVRLDSVQSTQIIYGFEKITGFFEKFKDELRSFEQFNISKVERMILAISTAMLINVGKQIKFRIASFNEQVYLKSLASSSSLTSSYSILSPYFSVPPQEMDTSSDFSLSSQDLDMPFFDLLEKLNALVVDLDGGQLEDVMLNIQTLEEVFPLEGETVSLRERIYFHHKGPNVYSAKKLKDAIAQTGIEILLEGFEMTTKEKGGKEAMNVYMTHFKTIRIWQPFMNEVIKLVREWSKKMSVDQINQDQLALDAMGIVRAGLKKEWLLSR